MKSLEDFTLIREFLISQGIHPTVAMVAMEDKAWQDLAILAGEWKAAEEERAEDRAYLDPAELEMRDKLEAEERRLEKELLMFHSCGHHPRRDHNA